MIDNRTLCIGFVLIMTLIYYLYIILTYTYLEIFKKKTINNDGNSQFESLINTSL